MRVSGRERVTDIQHETETGSTREFGGLESEWERDMYHRFFSFNRYSKNSIESKEGKTKYNCDKNGV